MSLKAYGSGKQSFTVAILLKEKIQDKYEESAINMFYDENKSPKENKEQSWVITPEINKILIGLLHISIRGVFKRWFLFSTCYTLAGQRKYFCLYYWIFSEYITVTWIM